jgi:hypothetical protein
MPFDNNLRYSFEEAHINFIHPILIKAYSEDYNLTNADKNILSPFCFYLGNELKKKEPSKKVIIDCLNEIVVQKSEFIISDNYLLIESIETRGEKLISVKSSEEENSFFKQILSDLKVKLPQEWTELISIIKSISFVEILGKENFLNHFSGSDTYRWGAMHMYKNLTPLNIAECITHEASHYWLNLYELYCPAEFISKGWANQSFISPWRNDRRPLMGIFHGIYVFSNVFIVLNYLNNQCGEEELERLYRIGAQVKRGLETIESQESRLSKEAKDVFYQIKNRFLKVYEKTENGLRLKHFDAILKEEYLKKNTLSCRI